MQEEGPEPRSNTIKSPVIVHNCPAPLHDMSPDQLCSEARDDCYIAVLVNTSIGGVQAERQEAKYQNSFNKLKQLQTRRVRRCGQPAVSHKSHVDVP